MLMLPFLIKYFILIESRIFFKAQVFLPLKCRVRALNGIDQSLININRIDYRPDIEGPLYFLLAG